VPQNTVPGVVPTTLTLSYDHTFLLPYQAGLTTNAPRTFGAVVQADF